MIHLLLFAGVWNVAAEHDMVSGSYETTLIVKLVVVAVSGGFPHSCMRAHAAPPGWLSSAR